MKHLILSSMNDERIGTMGSKGNRLYIFCSCYVRSVKALLMTGFLVFTKQPYAFGVCGCFAVPYFYGVRCWTFFGKAKPRKPYAIFLMVCVLRCGGDEACQIRTEICMIQ